MVGATEAVAHAQHAGAEVGEQAWDEEGVDLLVAARVEGEGGVVEDGQGANAGAETDACCFEVGRCGWVPVCGGEGFGGGGEGVLGEFGGFMDFLFRGYQCDVGDTYAIFS